MTVYQPVARKNWIFSTLRLWMFATVFERALAPLDKTLSAMGTFRFLALLLTPGAMFLAATISVFGFWRKFGLTSQTLNGQKILVPSFLFVWSVISILLVGILARFPHGFIIYAAAFMAQAIVGCGFGYLAVILYARRFRDRALGAG